MLGQKRRKRKGETKYERQVCKNEDEYRTRSKSEEDAKQGETNSAIHARNQNCIRRQRYLLKTAVKARQTTLKKRKF